MKTAKEVYRKADQDARDYDYQPMLSEFGEILLQVDDEDYQGDSRLLYKAGEKIGYLNFGWGSCSGCDALMACESIEDVQELMDELFSEIKWFDSAGDALDWFYSHDWEGDYTYHREEQRTFILEAFKILEQLNKGE